MQFYSMRHLILTALSGCLFACAVGPDYVRPPVEMPVKYKEAKGKNVIAAKKGPQWKVAQPRDNFDRGEWWKIFHDPTLNQLEAELNQSNQSVINSYYNYVQALAVVDEARAGFFPTLNGNVNITRQKQGTGTTSFVSNTSGGVSAVGVADTGGSASNINLFHTWSLQAAWEPDIWGLVRRTVEANRAGADASADLYASTRLSSQASLAQFYFQARGLDKIQKILDATVVGYKKALKITQDQYRAGTVSRSDVVQAQSTLESTQALAINNGIARAQYEHAIAVLMGKSPAEFSLKFSPLTASPPPIPLELPSELLERRPDVAQAERLMAQASAEIGVATAAYFPTLSLTGTVSMAGQNLADWFSVPAMGWAYGPQLSGLIFDGGLRSAQVRAAKAGYQASIASYRQVVLTALQDVEDNLVSLRVLNQQIVTERKALASARLASKLVMNQYMAGTVDYNSVITAQANALTAEQSVVNVEYQRMTSAVGLVRALGGGWSGCVTAMCPKGAAANSV